MKIYLVGLPGSGKTTVGKALAQSLGLGFIDLDQKIEQEATMFIDEIFASYGEKFFRALETNVLKEVKTEDNVVISTGGGIVCNKKNKEYMNGVVIYLTCPLPVIENRLKEDPAIRPLMKKNSIEALFAERDELYRYFMDVSVENVDLSQCVKKIAEVLK